MKHLDHLDDLFNKDLYEEERLKLLKSIEQDPDKKEEMEILITMEEVLRRQDGKKKLEFLKSLEASSKGQVSENRKTISMFARIALAASALLIAGFFFWSNSNPTSESLYGSYYEKYPALDVVRSGDVNKSLEMEAYVLYNEGNYEQASEKFQKLETKKSRFFLALCLMEQSAFDESREILHKIDVNNVDFPLNFYLGLVNLKLERYEEARSSFKNVSKEPKHYKDRANEILNILPK